MAQDIYLLIYAYVWMIYLYKAFAWQKLFFLLKLASFYYGTGYLFDSQINSRIVRYQMAAVIDSIW